MQHILSDEYRRYGKLCESSLRGGEAKPPLRPGPTHPEVDESDEGGLFGDHEHDRIGHLSEMLGMECFLIGNSMQYGDPDARVVMDL